MLKNIMFGLCFMAQTAAMAQDAGSINSIGEANELINKLKNNTIPQLREIHQCYVDARNIVDDYLGTKQLWVGKSSKELPLLIDAKTETALDGFDLNVYRNMDGLGVYQSKFFAELQAFIRVQNVEPAETIELMQEKIRRLDQSQIGLGQTFYEIAKKDSLFLTLLSQIKIRAEREHSRITSEVKSMITGRCKNAGLEPVVAFMESDVKKVVANIEKLRAFTLDSTDKRNLIAKRAYEGLRQKLVDAYTQKAGEQLGKIGSEATDILKLVKVGEEMLNWWTEANTNGLADSTHLKYLQFENPRALLMVEKRRAEVFHQKLLDIKYAPAEMSAYYLTRLASFQKTIAENLKSLTDRGWKGQLERQVLLNTKRKSAATRLTPECIQSLERHLGASQQAQTLEQFRTAEYLYALSLNSCRS